MNIESKVNQLGVPIGPNGYVICTICGREVSEISRETGPGYAQCLSHRVQQQFKPITSRGDQIMSKESNQPKEAKVKKEKAPRAKVERAIQWFQDKAEKTQNLETIKASAKEEGYKPSTISIQLGRLRRMGLLPALEPKAPKEPKAKKEKGESKRKPKEPKEKKTFHPAPKPSQKED